MKQYSIKLQQMKKKSVYNHTKIISEGMNSPLWFHSLKNMHIMSSGSPEQARHCVPGSVVQRGVVLVGFTIGRVGIQSVSELLVALVQLAG